MESIVVDTLATASAPSRTNATTLLATCREAARTTEYTLATGISKEPYHTRKEGIEGTSVLVIVKRR